MTFNRDRLVLEVRRARGPFVVLMILVVCSVVVSGVLISKQTFQRPWEDYKEVRVAFDDAKGVVPGQQQVRIAGVKVGLIKDADLEGRRAVVTLAIEERYAPVYRNATFRLRPKTPLQDMYVEMKRGTRSAGILADGDTVPAAQTVTPVDVSRVLQAFNGDTRVRLQALLDGFGRGVGDGEALRRTFVEAAPFLTTTQQVTEQLAVRRQRLRRLVTSSANLMSELGRKDDELAGLVRYGHQTLGTLARNDAPLAVTISELPGTVQALRSSLTEFGRAQDELDPALVALRPVARQLPAGLRAAERLSDDLTPAAEALEPALAALQPLSRSLPRAARGLRRTSTSLRPGIKDLDLIQRQLRACEVPFSRFFAWTLSVIKFRDGFSAYPRGTITLGPDSIYDNKSGPTGLTKNPNCSAEVK